MAPMFLNYVLVFFCHLHLGSQQKLDNTISKLATEDGETSRKATTFYDYHTRMSAYKDLIGSGCYIEFIKNGEPSLSQRIREFPTKKLPGALYIEEKLSKRRIWDLAGPRIWDFCKGFPTYLLQEVKTSETNDIDIISNDIIKTKSRRKRSTSHYFVGRLRGQTQSQYMNFGNSPNNSGKAEAESTYGRSMATVVGTNGMGQAQSQSSPFDCDDCYNKPTKSEFEPVKRPGGVVGGDWEGSTAPGYGTRVEPGASTEIQTPGGYGRPGAGSVYDKNMQVPQAEHSGITGIPSGTKQPTGIAPGEIHGGTDGTTISRDPSKTAPVGPSRTVPYPPGHVSNYPQESYPIGPSSQHSGGSGHLAPGQPVSQYPGSSNYPDRSRDGFLPGPGYPNGNLYPKNDYSNIKPLHPGTHVSQDRENIPIPGQLYPGGGTYGPGQTYPGVQTHGDRGVIPESGQLYPSGVDVNRGQAYPGIQTPSGGGANLAPGQVYPPGIQTNRGQAYPSYQQTVGGGQMPESTPEYANGKHQVYPGHQITSSGVQISGQDGYYPSRQEYPGYQLPSKTGSSFPSGVQAVDTGRGHSGRFSGHFSGVFDINGHKAPSGGEFQSEIYSHPGKPVGPTGTHGIQPGSQQSSQDGYQSFTPSGPRQPGYGEQSNNWRPGYGQSNDAGAQAPNGYYKPQDSVDRYQPGVQQLPHSGYRPDGFIDPGTFNPIRDSGQSQYKPQFEGGGTLPGHYGGGNYYHHQGGHPGREQYGPTQETHEYKPNIQNPTQPGIGPGGQVDGYGQGLFRPGLPTGQGHYQPIPGTSDHYKPISGQTQFGEGQTRPKFGRDEGYGRNHYQPGQPSGQEQYQPIPGKGYQYKPAPGLISTSDDKTVPQTGTRITPGDGYGGDHYHPGISTGGDQYQPIPGTDHQYRPNIHGQTDNGQTPSQSGKDYYRPGLPPGHPYIPTIPDGRPDSAGRQGSAKPESDSQNQPGATLDGISNLNGSDSKSENKTAKGTLDGDDSDSQAQTSVQQLNNETQATAQAQGRFESGTAQSQVSGTYSGSGSFSAAAGSDDGKKGVLTQVSGGKQGATGNAQGHGGKGRSQAQIQLFSDTGKIMSSAQSGGSSYSSQTQVQGGEDGGMANAQSNGSGHTSSQAQIGFSPYKKEDSNDQNQNNHFLGGGTANAQGGSTFGQSESQIQGKFQYGIKYTGGAQAQTGNGQKRNFTSIPSNSLLLPQLNAFISQSKPSHENSSTKIAPDGTRDSITTQPTPNNEDDNEDYDYEENESEKSPTSNIITQTRNGQTQHIVLPNMRNLDARIVQTYPRSQEEENLMPGQLFQPGELIPGISGYRIPPGFRGKIKAVASPSETYAVGKHSQAQSVTIMPGNGKIVYHKMKPSHNYRSVNEYDPYKYYFRSGENSVPGFVSISKSETGYENPLTGKRVSSTHYTQSSTCGFITHTCVMRNNQRVCLPNVMRNSDGSVRVC